MKIYTKLLSTIKQSQCVHIGKCNSSPFDFRSFASFAPSFVGKHPIQRKRCAPSILSYHKRNLVYTSRYPAVDIPNEDLFSFVSANFPYYKNKVVTVDAVTGKSCTYQQLHEGALSLGSALIKRGLQPGEVVGICAPNCVEYMMAMIAVTGVGASLSLVNQSLADHEMEVQFGMAGVKFLITTNEILPVVAKALSTSSNIQEVFVIGASSDSSASSLDSLLADDGSAFPSESERRSIIDPASHVAFIPFSSGTTGMPKGVELTHRNMIANTLQLSHPEFSGPAEDGSRDRGLSVLPMWHSYMLMCSLVVMRFGTMVATMPKFDPLVFLKTISEQKLGFLPIVPPLIIFLLEYKELVDKYDLTSVKDIVSGAAPLGPDTHAAISERLGISRVRQGWGMSELSPAATLGPASEPVPGSCGVIVPSTEIKVVSVNDRSMLGEGQEGEIAVRGPQVMKGYLNNPKATNEMIDDEGWLYTGDIGNIDSHGHLRIVDRLKELIKYKGHQVAPAELEDVLLSHPSIADAAVIGIPETVGGEVPRAFVKLQAGAELAESDVVEFVNGRVGAFSWLRGGAEFLDAIPKSPSGKILRRELREKYKRETSV